MKLANNKEFKECTEEEVMNMIRDGKLIVEKGLTYTCSMDKKIGYDRLMTLEGDLVDISAYDCTAGNRGSIPPDIITPICRVKMKKLLNGGVVMKTSDLPSTFCEVQLLIEKTPEDAIKH